MLDAAQQQVPDGVEADRVQAQRGFDGGSYLFQREVLQQAQYLDILAAGLLEKPRFDQPPQLVEALRQFPSRQWRGLIQSAALVFQQRQTGVPTDRSSSVG